MKEKYIVSMPFGSLVVELNVTYTSLVPVENLQVERQRNNVLYISSKGVGPQLCPG